MYVTCQYWILNKNFPVISLVGLCPIKDACLHKFIRFLYSFDNSEVTLSKSIFSRIVHVMACFWNNFQEHSAAFEQLLESQEAIRKQEQASWREGYKKDFHNFWVISYKQAVTLVLIFSTNRQPKIAKTIRAYLKSTGLIFRTFKKLFTLWHYPFKLNACTAIGTYCKPSFWISKENWRSILRGGGCFLSTSTQHSYSPSPAFVS